MSELESLDERLAPSAMGLPSAPLPAPYQAPRTAYVAPAPKTNATGSASLPANIDQQLLLLYNAYMSGGSKAVANSGLGSQLVIVGDSVMVTVRTSASTTTLAQQLSAQGMRIQAVAATTATSTGAVQGLLPISEIPAVAYDNGVVSVTAFIKPIPQAPLGGGHHFY
jgi:hypothetical protein